MNELTYFIIWESIWLLFIIGTYFFLNNKKINILHLSCFCAVTLVCGYILFYETFELNHIIDLERKKLKLDELTKDKYNLKIDENNWIVEEWTDVGIQIGCRSYSLVDDGVSYILLNVSESAEYEGERDLLVMDSSFILEEVHNYNNLEIVIEQYTYYDGTSELYGDDYYNPYYIFEFKINNLYYDIRIINDSPSKEMLYTYDSNKIREEDLKAYFEYINSVICEPC